MLGTTGPNSSLDVWRTAPPNPSGVAVYFGLPLSDLMDVVTPPLRQHHLVDASSVTSRMRRLHAIPCGHGLAQNRVISSRGGES